MNCIGWARRCTGWLHAFVDAVVTVVALHRLVGDGIDIDRTVWADIYARSMAAARFIVDHDAAAAALVKGSARASFDTGRVLAVLAGHRQKHTGHFGVFANVFVKCLADVVPQRHIIFRFAGNLATMAAEAAPRVDEPTVCLAIVRGLHALLPVLFRLEQI